MNLVKEAYFMKKIFLVTLTVLACVTLVFAHSGRTNKDGCHTDRKTGIYHCH